MFMFISNKFNHKTQGTKGRKSEGIRGSQRIKVIWDTIYINVLSSFFATVIGVVTACFVFCADIRGKKFIHYALLLPLIIPGYIIVPMLTRIVTAFMKGTGGGYGRDNMTPENFFFAAMVSWFWNAGRCHSQLYLCGIHHLRLCTIHGRVHHDSGAGTAVPGCVSHPAA